MDGEESPRGGLGEHVRNNLLIFGFLGAGIVLLVIGLIQIMGSRQAEIKFEEGAEISSNSEIKVDIDGQVFKPGLYTLKSDARLADALTAAGGLTADANRKAINLAQKLSDGQKIYIPQEGEELSVLGSGNALNPGSAGAISINNASQSELEELPGIGAVRASEIIGSRPYGSIEELRTRKILGEKTYDSVKDLISL